MNKPGQVIKVDKEPVRISVVIPCYNLAPFVGKAIESALSQSLKPVDVTVVDNGSEDNLDDVIDGYRDSIQYTRVSPNKGVSYARNLGAKKSSGNWLLFLDADDHLNEDALKALAESAEAGGSGVVFGGIIQYDTDTGKTSRRDSPTSQGEPPVPAIRGFWRSAIATPGAAVVHRTVHESIGGFEKPWQPTEDRDYWLKCGVTTAFRYCEHPVLIKLKRADSMRTYSAWLPFWGLRVQLEFIDWCRERDIDTGFLDVKVKDVVREAVSRIQREGSDEIMQALVEFCAERKISTFQLNRQRMRLKWKSCWREAAHDV